MEGKQVTKATITVTKGRIDAALKWVKKALEQGLETGAIKVELSKESRSAEQNRLLWPLLKDVSDQLEWSGMKLGPDDWKDLLTVAWKIEEGEQIRMVPSLDMGRVICLGLRTSQMNKKDFSSLIESIFAYGTQNGVVFSDQSNSNYYEVMN